MEGNYIRRISSNSFNRKIILMGEKDVGKTSIFSMIFTNVYPIETILFGNTISISLSQIIFSGGELIELDGEYLAWHSKNVRLVNCHLAGEQLLCYADNLVLEKIILKNTSQQKKAYLKMYQLLFS